MIQRIFMEPDSLKHTASRALHAALEFSPRRSFRPVTTVACRSHIPTQETIMEGRNDSKIKIW